MVKKKTKQWISATISKEMDDVVRQKANELYNGNYSKALDHIISVYKSMWTDLMMARIRFELMKALPDEFKKLIKS